MILFFLTMFFVVLFVGWRLHFTYPDAVAVAFSATGRDFEIAIAIAITAFSPTVALATVVGPLIEVPVMLFLVWSAMRLAPRWFGVKPGESTPTVRAGAGRTGGVMATRMELPVLPELRLQIAPPDVADVAATAALLGDPIRAGIIAILGSGPHCVCEMAAALGERQNNVSNHLAKLRRAGLVRASRHMVDARWVYYERDEAACAAALASFQRLLR